MTEYESEEEICIEMIETRLSRKKSKTEDDRKDSTHQKKTKFQIQKELLLQSQNPQTSD